MTVCVRTCACIRTIVFNPTTVKAGGTFTITGINRSINQTLARTVLTSGTTLLACLALFIFGGGVIHSFALTMLCGVIIGTYSSIFVASPILIALGDTAYYVRVYQKVEYEKPGEHGIV